MKGNTALIAGVAVGALLLAAIAYLVGIAPRLSRASEAQEARTAAQDQNQLLQANLDALIADSLLVPEFEEQIRAIREDLRPEFDRTRVRDAIQDVADANGIVIGSENITTPEILVPSVVFGPAAEAAGVTAQSDGLVFSGVVYTGVGLQIAGSVDQVVGFIDDIQYGDHEFFLMSSLTLEPVWTDVRITDVVLTEGDLIANLVFHVFTLDYGNPDVKLPDPWEWERAPELVCVEPANIGDAVELAENPPEPEPVPSGSASATPAPEPSPSATAGEEALPACPVNDHNVFAPLN